MSPSSEGGELGLVCPTRKLYCLSCIDDADYKLTLLVCAAWTNPLVFSGACQTTMSLASLWAHTLY